MKKIISLILMIAMMLSIGISSFAEEDVSITFRGIPWGSSPDEAISMIKEGLGLDEIEVSYVMHETYYFSQYKALRTGEDFKFVIPVLECKIAIPDLVVAGHMAKGGFVNGSSQKYNIILYFMPVLSEDRTTYSLSEHDGALWRAVYPRLIQQEGTTSLYKKLEGLYGEKRGRIVSVRKYSKGQWKTENEYYEYWAAEDGIVEITQYKDYTGQYELDYRCIIDSNLKRDAGTIQTIYQTEVDKAKKEAEEADTSGTDGL